MGMQNHHNHNTNTSLILSTDAKPRLKWTPELHLRFVEAITHLGGADKATPKSLMRVIGIPGLTLYHLKSHLQKYRLGKSQKLEYSCGETCQQDSKENREEHEQSLDILNETSKEDAPTVHVNRFQIAQALRLQLEVQRQLHEQMEVQKRLQQRIEAQAKYLQSVLSTAQETLAKAELSHLVSMVDSGCQCTSISELTEIGNTSSPESQVLHLFKSVTSVESSLTSSESLGRKHEPMQPQNGNSAHRNRGGKRTTASTYNNSEHKSRKCQSHVQIDLNCQYMNECDSDTKADDLNSQGTVKQSRQS